jgi:hypothetical protein
MTNAQRRRHHKHILIVNPKPEQTKAGNYLTALLAAGADIAPGTVHHVSIAHDDWCDLLTSRGPCNCTPDIRVTEAA